MPDKNEPSVIVIFPRILFQTSAFPIWYYASCLHKYLHQWRKIYRSIWNVLEWQISNTKNIYIIINMGTSVQCGEYYIYIYIYTDRNSSLSVNTCCCTISFWMTISCCESFPESTCADIRHTYRITGIITTGHNIIIILYISTTCENRKYKDSADQKRNRAETVVRAAFYTQELI